ncbi:MAG TPA: SRPBCC family protein [Actinomycetota bacterium]|nr:SRPBCC family protein [Actinomycetota bacterium]
MKIENTVEVDAPLDRVWALVNDIPRVAPCMPGAALTGVLDDKTYEGTVAVKLGPLRMSYKGKVTVDEIDDAGHSARLTASGKDTKGAGTARASVETRLEPAGDTHTRLHVTSDVQLTGKVASFGRGGAISDVATRLFGQFADCLRATLEAEQAATAGPAGEAAVSAGATAPEAAGATAPEPSPATTGTTPATTGTSPATPGTTPATTGTSPATPAEAAPPSAPVAAGDGATTAGGGAASAPAPVPVSPAPPPRAAEALDAGSLVGTVIKGRLQALFQAITGFFRRLFGRRSAG